LLFPIFFLQADSRYSQRGAGHSGITPNINMGYELLLRAADCPSLVKIWQVLYYDLNRQNSSLFSEIQFTIVSNGYIDSLTVLIKPGLK
jgi:hypothetical protein